jgi:hypothetical protein
MAEGIRETVGNSQLITFHPRGSHSSSEKLHKEPWLDFNMIQSSHGSKFQPNYQQLVSDRKLQPVKPVLDGEPRLSHVSGLAAIGPARPRRTPHSARCRDDAQCQPDPNARS